MKKQKLSLKVKKPKRKPRLYKWWYKKLDREMSKLVRSKGFCEMCGSRTNQLQWSHVISRVNKTLRWDIFNSMCLCSYCHQYKWHDSPLEARNWFRNKYPIERYRYLMKAKLIILNRTEEDYAEIRKNIRERNLRNLVLDLDI